ncbi:MAG: DUF1080 domain-containing protein [Bacteroidota bacterium]
MLCAVLVGCAPAKKANPESLPEAEAAGDMRMLFDGQSFEGWEGVNAFFRIENEAIVAGTTTQPIPQNEFLCSIDRFSDFRLELETRLVGDETNAGIQFHTERIPGDNEVIGYQADIGAGYWGGIYDESRRNKMLVTADEALIDEILKPGAWNTYLLEAKGPNFRIAINGVQTVAYTEEDPDIPLEGHICLQIHSGPPGEQWYKSIALETL